MREFIFLRELSDRSRRYRGVARLSLSAWAVQATIPTLMRTELQGGGCTLSKVHLGGISDFPEQTVIATGLGRWR